jgi:hypothetical protein
LTNLGLVTSVSAAGFATKVILSLTPGCSFKGLWTVAKDAMTIGGAFHWEYGGTAPLNADGLASFSSQGMTLTTTRVGIAALYGIEVKKLQAVLPAFPGQPLVATIELAIPEGLSIALHDEIDVVAKQAKSELENARQLSMQQLSVLQGYELSLDGVKNLLGAICNAAAQAIRNSVGKLPATKTYGRWPFKKTVKVRDEASKEVAPYILTLEGFAQTFGKSTSISLAGDVESLVNWAVSNKRHPVKRYGVTVTTVTILGDQTVAELQTIKANIPGWIAHLPEHRSGLTLSGTMIDYAKGTVNAALNDIANALDTTGKNVPTLTGLWFTSDLNGVKARGVKIRMEVTRNDKTKGYDLPMSFDNPAAGAKELFNMVMKDLGKGL